MNNTPETDAKASDIIGFFSCATVPADFARKLERERDEAQKHLRDIEEYGTKEINAAVELRQKLADALLERDKAREDATNYYARIGELEGERDEAIFVMRETRRRLDDAWLEIERLKSK